MSTRRGKSGSLALTRADVDALDRLGPEALREAGCNCEMGCRNCGMPRAMMGACASWEACPVGRARGGGCPVHGDE